MENNENKYLVVVNLHAGSKKGERDWPEIKKHFALHGALSTFQDQREKEKQSSATLYVEKYFGYP